MFKLKPIRTNHNITLLDKNFRWILVDVKDKGIYRFKRPLWTNLFRIKEATIPFGEKRGFFLEISYKFGNSYPEPKDFHLQLKSWGIKNDGTLVDLSFGKWADKQSIDEINMDEIPEDLRDKVAKELI